MARLHLTILLLVGSILSLLSTYPTGVSSAEVSLAPKLVDLVEKLNNQEGTNATISCSVGSGDLEGLVYEWYKDDHRLSTSSHGSPNKIKIITSPENYQSILRVTDLKPSDAGVYSCMARNSYGSDRITIRLNVKVQLKWTVEPTDVKGHAGKPVHVPCKADGVPAARIVWQRLDSDEIRDLGSELTFSAVSPSDSGFYECRAINGVDKDLSRRIRLDVLGK